MSILISVSSSDKTKKAATEILNTIDGLSIHDAKDAIKLASESLDYVIKKNLSFRYLCFKRFRIRPKVSYFVCHLFYIAGK
jgi:hypothetical protein